MPRWDATNSDLIGQQFTRLTIVEFAFTKKRKRYWKCLCVCGNITYNCTATLRGGESKSCGCWRDDILRARERPKKPKLPKPPKPPKPRAYYYLPEYKTWGSMRARCLNPKHSQYKDYGGRGITIIPEWYSFAAFYADMGPRPSPQHSIDRINNDLGYSPENCRWATRKEQARNKRNTILLTYRGETMTIPDWAQTLGIKAKIIRNRMRYGWSVERILSESVIHKS